ncbi:hypothetical protein F5Y19DRAFT_461202 [Xylariaceae sp. FL1651]|nr:hypothetical protein F5Y19DRAFT_461202 [Xylariaceae sp. FL1651]
MSANVQPSRQTNIPEEQRAQDCASETKKRYHSRLGRSLVAEVKSGNGSTKSHRKRAVENQRSSAKRARKETPSSEVARTERQLQLPTIPASTSFQSLKVTKHMGKVEGSISAKTDNQTTPLSHSARLSDHWQNAPPQVPVTTVEQLTPYPTRKSQASSDPTQPEAVYDRAHDHEQLASDFPNDEFPWLSVIPGTPEKTPADFVKSENVRARFSDTAGWGNRQYIDGGQGITQMKGVRPIHNRGAAVGQTDSNDDYPLDEDLADEDIIGVLANPSGPVHENHIPPSSVQEWDHESRSAAEYDPTLQYSSPRPAGKMDTNVTVLEPLPSIQGILVTSEDLLDDDIDWNAVFSDPSVFRRDSSVDSSFEIEASASKNPGISTKETKEVYPRPDESGPMPPFVRPSFPERVRDRPLVPGLSSETMLRTCFRIGMMINQTARCFNHQQDVVFELYARVTYSNREVLARKQHFQFVDLFKDQQPYPAATLTGWKAGSQLDRDSSRFLDISGGPRLCWCMCKPMKDPKATLRWTYTVLAIKEVDWEQIRWVKRLICGNLEEQPTKIITANL